MRRFKKTRSYSSAAAFICCWVCGSRGMEGGLRKVGEKDYVCRKHEQQGEPSIADQSKFVPVRSATGSIINLKKTGGFH